VPSIGLGKEGLAVNGTGVSDKWEIMGLQATKELLTTLQQNYFCWANVEQNCG
jgi:hypothetical protein